MKRFFVNMGYRFHMQKLSGWQRSIAETCNPEIAKNQPVLPAESRSNVRIRMHQQEIVMAF